MKISYAITVKDELNELKSLCNKLERWLEGADYEWEIVILKDYFEDPASQEFKRWQEYMDSIDDKLVANKYQFLLKPFSIHPDTMSFAEHKNTFQYNCKGEYIFQLDADEYPSSILVDYLGTLIEQNFNIDLIWVPRVNTVSGITTEHLQRWGWSAQVLEGVELMAINWPDYQGRIYRNDPKIRWVNKVHEHIEGATRYTKLPMEVIWAIFHPKTIEKQEAQNAKYMTMQR